MWSKLFEIDRLWRYSVRVVNELQNYRDAHGLTNTTEAGAKLHAAVSDLDAFIKNNSASHEREYL
jgi:hypothetical protein